MFSDYKGERFALYPIPLIPFATFILLDAPLVFACGGKRREMLMHFVCMSTLGVGSDELSPSRLRGRSLQEAVQYKKVLPFRWGDLLVFMYVGRVSRLGGLSDEGLVC